ncbi:DinB family protein [Chitinophaga cymbidii]|uniref:DinB-like domain-containing protein n=1 Tax=Chitinophaga cymbidii TaxID=1096750 RepID=A0A512RP80_9BACT|nr:DinB family protein [Chitinophaga cymbidii]GEP97491.1 hypothetical protein CCY01nite_37510 [Chitinophaga cymbidii]
MEPAEIFVQAALKSWNIQLKRADAFFDTISDEGLQQEIAPGKNRLIYLMGHLIAVNDSMTSLFGQGERSFEHLDDAFVKNPDRSGLPMPDAASLREDWRKAKSILTANFAALSPADWMSRHTAMTDEDFAKEPSRNKLSVLLNRTNHMAYHIGQMVLVKGKS